MSEARRSMPALEVKGLDVYYGHSHALQGVDVTLQSGVFSVVGRNGMGKTTLCKAIMGLVPTSGGSIRIRGEEITGLSRVISSPRTRTEPPLDRNRPMMVLHSVVLPMPLRPTTENTPESSVRSTPCKACEWP